MSSTLDKFAHFDKQKMSKQNHKLNKDAQKMIAVDYIHQWLRVFALLNTKRGGL